jgi:dihydroorotate dehydrogenase electron transfer subunit
MPVDIEARVIANTRLSPDYNVIALAAPAIAASLSAGQFVMVKPGRAHDPLLRRPFSVFQILRDESASSRPDAPPVGLTLLSKRVGITTTMLYDAVAGDVISCLGPLGKPFTLVDAPAEAWMVAGGVGLAPFATVTEALRARGTPMTLFYGARSAKELFYLDWFRSQGVRLVLTTEDGSQGERGRVTAPLERELTDARGRTVQIYACGPEPMLEAVAHVAAKYSRPCEVSVERVMGCGMGGCYSCVMSVREETGPHFVRSCLQGPVFDAARIVWD